MSAAAIEAIGLQKTYFGSFGRRGQRALCEVDLRVPRGEAYGLIGPNGAGKTSFIKIILSVVRPTAGRVRVLGGDPEDPTIRARIGYLPERLELPGAATPLSFLATVARFKRLPVDPAGHQRLCERVGVGRDSGRRIRTFSKGMRQRVGLAAALLGAPDLLVLDEPTDGVDPIGRVEIRNLLVEELARGATVFLNSHLLAETERICTRVGILAEGRVVREGPLESLCGAEGRWRARFAEGAASQALEAAGFTPGARGWLFSGGDPAALNVALDRARGSGALLLELRKDERDLEEVLAEALEVRS